MKTKFFAALIAMIAIFVYDVASAQKMTILDGVKPSVSGSGLKIEGEVKLGGIYTISDDIEIINDINNVRISFITWGGTINKW